MSGTQIQPVPVPVIVGVTGHRDIDPAAIPKVEAAVGQVLMTPLGEFRCAAT
jgi:hypothetical protein